MKKQVLTACFAAGILTFSTGAALAVDPAANQEQLRTQERAQEQIYGSQMMTEQEREMYQARMRAAKTAGEQEQIRMEHHEQMKERARAQGLSLPDTPPQRGGKMAPGGGMGGGGGRMGGGSGGKR